MGAFSIYGTLGGLKVMGAGDVIFHFTDGVTEAMDIQGRFFTGATLVDTLKQTVGMPADETVNAALAKIHDFASGACLSTGRRMNIKTSGERL